MLQTLYVFLKICQRVYVYLNLKPYKLYRTLTLQKKHFELLNWLKIKVIYYIFLVSSEHTIFSCMYVVHVITYLEAFAESLRGDKSAQEEIIISSN